MKTAEEYVQLRKDEEDAALATFYKTIDTDADHDELVTVPVGVLRIAARIIYAKGIKYGRRVSSNYRDLEGNLLNEEEAAKEITIYPVDDPNASFNLPK